MSTPELHLHRAYACSANHNVTTTITITITPQTAGVTCLLLPLRGESLAAWLNFVFMAPGSAEDRHHLVPERLVSGIVAVARMFAIAVVLGRRGLRRAHGIGGRKTMLQAGLKPLVHLAVGRERFLRVGGVLVARRGIEFLSHGYPAPRDKHAADPQEALD